MTLVLCYKKSGASDEVRHFTIDRIGGLVFPVLCSLADVGLVAQLGHLQYLDKANTQHLFRQKVKIVTQFMKPKYRKIIVSLPSLHLLSSYLPFLFVFGFQLWAQIYSILLSIGLKSYKNC